MLPFLLLCYNELLFVVFKQRMEHNLAGFAGFRSEAKYGTIDLVQSRKMQEPIADCHSCYSTVCKSRLDGEREGNPVFGVSPPLS